MAIKGGYAPPGVYTQSVFENPSPQATNLTTVPVFIGTGRETVISNGIALTRGSSATTDQQIVEEDATGRAVLSKNADGTYVLGDFNGTSKQLRVKLWPIVTGDGTATVSMTPGSVSVSVNSTPVVVLGVNGEDGIVSISVAPKSTDQVYVSYFFDRTDTLINEEDLSNQVTSDRSILRNTVSATFDYALTAATNSLVLLVDGATKTISLPTTDTNRSENLARIVNSINAGSVGTLEASVYTDNLGVENLELSAAGSLVVGSGTANGVLGLFDGQTGTIRNKVFYTNYSPIVDGSNGGITTTDVSKITVLVNGAPVTASTVDGSTGAITLSSAPAVGATVAVTYYYNSFRDQFDYLPARGVTQILRVSDVPVGGSPASLYDEDVSWVLKDDKIIWGSAALITSVENSTFSIGKASASISDEKIYLAECAPVVAISGGSSVVSSTTFKLPYQPVDGSGGGVPTSRTDLVQIKVGYNIADAIGNSAVSVARVNPSDSTVTLSSAVSAGQKVYATFYYNVLQDQSLSAEGGYTLTSATAGRSGVGTYKVSRAGSDLFNLRYAGKGSDLTLTSLNFPSGSELQSDAKFSSGVPVEENITVQIESVEGNPAIYVNKGFGPYALGDLDFDLELNGVSIETFSTNASQHLATIVGNALPYTVESNNTNLGNIDGSLLLEIDGQAVTVDVSAVNADVSDFVSALNTASTSVSASYTAMGRLGAKTVHIFAGSFDDLTIGYVGITALGVVARTEVTITIPNGDYTAAELAAEIQDGIITEFDGLLSNSGAGTTNLTCTADSLGRMVFTLEDVGTGDLYGYIEFVSSADDLAVVIGVDVDAADGTQSKFGILPIADFTTTDLSGVGDGEPLKSRLILKNRFMPGIGYIPPNDTLGVSVIGGDLMTLAGLTSDMSCKARALAKSKDIVLPLRNGWSSKDTITSQSAVIFYDGTGAESANNVLILIVNGETKTITFSATGAGVTTNLSDIADDITTVISTATAEVRGDLIILTQPLDANAYIEVGNGSANAAFDLNEGDVFTSDTVPASNLASALMSHVVSNGVLALRNYLFSTDIQSLSGVYGNYYGKYAVSYTHYDAVNRSYVGFETLDVGVSSNILFLSSTGVNEQGSGLYLKAGDGSVGEDPYQGFFVTSDNPAGSGSANTSRINDGTGEDGVVGQTYVDSVTGFSFTLLEREGGLQYATGVNATLSFVSSTTIKTNNTLPVNVIPGVLLSVSNTTGVSVGDTLVVETFAKGGNEPTIGQTYYLDLVRSKTAFGTAVFNRIADVIAEFGDISPQNTLSMAAYYAFINGSSSIALKQIPLEDGQIEITTEQMLQALQEIEGEVLPGVLPLVIVPLIPANDILLAELSKHCDLQSSLRYRAERTAIVGFGAGTLPEAAQRMARNTKNSRVRLVYPDIVSSTLTNARGVTQTFLLDGRYMAVALSAATTTQTIDSATPWTNRSVVGFDTLSRNLDAVSANQTANAGVTVLQQRGGQIIVRHGLTTDVSSILTKTPTVIQISDDIHRRCRTLLDGYIGEKFTSGVTGQIEGRVNALFQQLVRDQIIDSYTGLSVVQDPEDPTGLLIEVYYRPVFPLLYIQFTFYVRSSN